jgi:hypothetical protein
MTLVYLGINWLFTHDGKFQLIGYFCMALAQIVQLGIFVQHMDTTHMEEFKQLKGDREN